jgi:hypothetical protein
VSRWRGSFARRESGGGGATAGDCGGGRLGEEGAEEAEACGLAGEGERARFEAGSGRRRASGGAENEGAAATLDEPAAAGVPRRAGAQRAGAEGRGTWREALTRGPGRAEERGRRQTGGAGRREKRRRATVQLTKSKTCISLAPKITKFLLRQDHATKNIMQ